MNTQTLTSSTEDISTNTSPPSLDLSLYELARIETPEELRQRLLDATTTDRDNLAELITTQTNNDLEDRLSSLEEQVSLLENFKEEHTILIENLLDTQDNNARFRTTHNQLRATMAAQLTRLDVQAQHSGKIAILVHALTTNSIVQAIISKLPNAQQEAIQNAVENQSDQLPELIDEHLGPLGASTTNLVLIANTSAGAELSTVERLLQNIENLPGGQAINNIMTTLRATQLSSYYNTAQEQLRISSPQVFLNTMGSTLGEFEEVYNNIQLSRSVSQDNNTLLDDYQKLGRYILNPSFKNRLLQSFKSQIRNSSDIPNEYKENILSQITVESLTVPVALAFAFGDEELKYNWYTRLSGLYTYSRNIVRTTISQDYRYARRRYNLRTRWQTLNAAPDRARLRYDTSNNNYYEIAKEAQSHRLTDVSQEIDILQREIAIEGNTPNTMSQHNQLTQDFDNYRSHLLQAEHLEVDRLDRGSKILESSDFSKLTATDLQTLQELDLINIPEPTAGQGRSEIHNKLRQDIQADPNFRTQLEQKLQHRHNDFISTRSATNPKLRELASKVADNERLIRGTLPTHIQTREAQINHRRIQELYEQNTFKGKAKRWGGRAAMGGMIAGGSVYDVATGKANLETAAVQVAQNGLYFIPVVGSLVSGWEVIKGRTVSGQKLEGNERLAHLGFTALGVVSDALTVFGGAGVALRGAAVSAKIGTNVAKASRTSRLVSKAANLASAEGRAISSAQKLTRAEHSLDLARTARTSIQTKFTRSILLDSPSLAAKILTAPVLVPLKAARNILTSGVEVIKSVYHYGGNLYHRVGSQLYRVGRAPHINPNELSSLLEIRNGQVAIKEGLRATASLPMQNALNTMEYGTDLAKFATRMDNIANGSAARVFRKAETGAMVAVGGSMAVGALTEGTINPVPALATGTRVAAGVASTTFNTAGAAWDWAAHTDHYQTSYEELIASYINNAVEEEEDEVMRQLFGEEPSISTLIANWDDPRVQRYALRQGYNIENIETAYLENHRS